MHAKAITIRFYAELNDFLRSERQFKRFEYTFSGIPTVKDAIEAIGVPHTEIDLILVNGKSVEFEHKIHDKEDIAVYPVFESMDIDPLYRLRPKPLRITQFLADVNLGKLARYMRMLGFNTMYQTDFEDHQIIRISLEEKRIILTRDQGLLKHKQVTHGYWVRNTQIQRQVNEVVQRMDLSGKIVPFSRCMDCNGVVEPIAKSKIIHLLKEGTKRDYDEFYQCKSCNKVYWKGSHHQRMMQVVLSLVR